MNRRSWRTFVAGVVMAGGLSVSGAVFAGEECCPTVGGLDCQGCQQLFADNNQQLTDELAKMSCCSESSCCAPTSVCAEAGCADECAEGCCSLDECSGIEFGGWAQVGYHSGSTGLFNDNPDRASLHQLWGYVEKVADGSCGLDFGFRADLMFGIDSGDTQAFGNNDGRWDYQNGWDAENSTEGYGFAMPQLYAEIASGDLSVIVGHFYTLLGYEVVTAPDNFFYSHAKTMYNSEAFTHTGALATYSASDDTSVYAGWTAGWDTGFDQFGDGSSFLGGVSTSLSDDATLTYITTAGDFGAIGEGYSHSIVLDVAVADDLNYVFQSDYLDTDNTAAAGQAARESYGINQYMFYTIDDTYSAGVRVEWWNNNGVDEFATTLGLNIKPMDNVVIRPEVRWDDATADSTIFGIDAIMSF
jgi:hypothetical protein